MATVRVLFVGLEPTSIDFNSPEYAQPGLTAEKLQRVIDADIARLRHLGYDTDWCPLDTGGTAEHVLRDQLAAKSYECIVIGAGIRLFATQTPLFEKLINAVHSKAPAAKLAFNTSPADTSEAVQRWFPRSADN